MYGYIYETTNLINGKKYIGQHRASKFDNSYHGSGKLLHKAFKKYGIKNFETKIICKCDNEKELNEKEIYYINKFDASNNDAYYNVSIGGENWMTLVHHTDEARRKISEAGKGRVPSKETKKKISNTEKGKIVSKETRRKISEANKKRFQNPEERRKISETQKKTRKGETHSKEWNKHVSEALKNKKWIHKNNELKYVKLEELNSYLQQGWKLGKIDKIIKVHKPMSEIKKGGLWICNKNNESKYIYPSDLDSYLQQGWQKGRKYKESI